MLRTRGRPGAQLAAISYAGFNPAIRKLVHAARVRLRKRLPTAVKLVYDNYNALAIDHGPIERTSEAIVSLAVYARGVNLYLLDGAHLPDIYLKASCRGAETAHDSLQPERTRRWMDSPTIVRLLRAAVDAADSPFSSTSRVRTWLWIPVCVRQATRQAAAAVASSSYSPLALIQRHGCSSDLCARTHDGCRVSGPSATPGWRYPCVVLGAQERNRNLADARAKVSRRESGSAGDDVDVHAQVPGRVARQTAAALRDSHQFPGSCEIRRTNSGSRLTAGRRSTSWGRTPSVRQSVITQRTWPQRYRLPQSPGSHGVTGDRRRARVRVRADRVTTASGARVFPSGRCPTTRRGCRATGEAGSR